jgi:hypothetical protein
MVGGRTIGYRRRARGAETGIRAVRFALGTINEAGSVGSVSIRVAHAVRIHRGQMSPDRSTSMPHGCYIGSGES